MKVRGYHVVNAHEVRMARLLFAAVQFKNHGMRFAGSSCNLGPMLV
jgi:hypothetical protein